MILLEITSVDCGKEELQDGLDGRGEEGRRRVQGSRALNMGERTFILMLCIRMEVLFRACLSLLRV